MSEHSCDLKAHAKARKEERCRLPHAMLDYIFNKDGNIIGLECPTCKRKIFFVS